MMASRRSLAAVAIALAFILASLGMGAPALAAGGGPSPDGGRCFPGARTLSHFGDHVYPDTGNGGYTSLHTDVHLV